MLGLPKTTEMSKQLPKKAIYTKFQMNTAAKEKIDADISRITIVNEIAPNKVNIPSGEDVKSFFVLLVSLKKKEYDEKTIATLSKLIPQNILFVLEYENESRLAIYHTKVMQTAWMPTEEQKVELKGLNLDTVWENIVIAVGGVNIEKGNSLVEHISYDTIEGEYDSTIFTAEKNTQSFDKAFLAKKAIQDYVFTDGSAEQSIERRFAEDLDAAEEVCVYAKLPRTFQIPTPVGNYSPDWAIAFYEGTVKHIFFVAETKGTMETLNLRPIEQAKISCAKKLFNEMSNSKVVYHDVDSYQSLLNIMNSI